MSSNISADKDIIFQEYPSVLNKKIMEQFAEAVPPAADPPVVNQPPVNQPPVNQPPVNSPVVNSPVVNSQAGPFDKIGNGININTASIIMAVLVPLAFLGLVIARKSVTIEFFHINISGIILFIFNLIIFIITIKTINKIKKGFNCSYMTNADKTRTSTIKISDLGLTDNIINTLLLNKDSAICSDTLNYNNFNNLSTSKGYYGFFIFSIISQVIQLIFLSYFSINSENKVDNKFYIITFYILLCFNIAALFMALNVNMIANKIKFISNTEIKTFKTILDENLQNEYSILTQEEIALVKTSIANKKINEDYLVCNSTSILNEFKYKDLNNSFSGFLIVTLLIILIMFFFVTMQIFITNNTEDSFMNYFKFFVLSLSIGIVSGFVALISSLDNEFKNAEMIALITGFSSSAIPIIIMIILAIVNRG